MQSLIAAKPAERPAKRRMVLTPAQPVAAACCEVRPTVSLSDEDCASFEGVRAAQTETVNSHQQLNALMRRHADKARATHDQWARSPRAAWVQELLAELTASQHAELYEKQRKLRTLQADDFLTRWELSAEFASAIVSTWFEGRTLDDVLAKSEHFGHADFAGGAVLSGALVREMATGEDVKLPTLLPWVSALSPTQAAAATLSDDASAVAAPPASASMYRCAAHNHFETEARTRVPLDELEGELRARIASGAGGCGSLNTTHEYVADAPRSGVPLLDRYWELLDELSFTDDGAYRINERLYLIWKLQGYCTPYHQDIHVPPHFTIYNQVSGLSTFHFLPLLLGLYATHVGRSHGSAELAKLLETLRTRGIGEVATIGPRQMLLILPWGAHGVYVPRVPTALDVAATLADAPPREAAAVASTTAIAATANASLPRFELSVIRAAELFLWGLYEDYERRLMSEAPADEAWCDFVPPSDEQREHESRMLERFTVQQEALCAELGLSHTDWLYLAARLQRRWERDEPPPNGDDDGDEAS